MKSYLVIVYVSSATQEMDAQGLELLLEQSRRSNFTYDITSVLLHYDGTFMQAIEGAPDATSNLYERIRRDSRHRGVMELHRDQVNAREFDGWSMASGTHTGALFMAPGIPCSRRVEGRSSQRLGLVASLLATFAAHRR